MININTADVHTLTRLPYIGSSRARQIVSWRKSHGYFSSVWKLNEVPGIGEGIIDRIHLLVTTELVCWVKGKEHWVNSHTDLQVKRLAVPSISKINGCIQSKQGLIALMTALQKNREFEFKWVSVFTEIHIETVSQLPDIPSHLTVDSTREYIDLINPIWVRERYVGRFLNRTGDGVSLVLDGLQPAKLTFKRRLLQSYGLGVLYCTVMNWEILYGLDFIRVLWFPLWAIRILKQGAYQETVLGLMFFVFFIQSGHRNGLRIPLLLLICLVL